MREERKDKRDEKENHKERTQKAEKTGHVIRDTGTECSNSAQGINVRLRFSMFLLPCVGRDFLMGQSPLQGVLPIAYNICDF
jgi:hypothetical protein